MIRGKIQLPCVFIIILNRRSDVTPRNPCRKILILISNISQYKKKIIAERNFLIMFRMHEKQHEMSIKVGKTSLRLMGEIFRRFFSSIAVMVHDRVTLISFQ